MTTASSYTPVSKTAIKAMQKVPPTALFAHIGVYERKKEAVSLVVILCILFLLFAVYLLLIRPSKSEPDPRLLTDYAHRGLHDAAVPENSLAAFSAAVDAGVGIEMDLQLSLDGEVMVFHDATLMRMTGLDRRLSELTASELQKLCLCGTDEKIPRLAEVLQLVGGRVPLLLEIKGKAWDDAICQKINELLLQYEGLYCIESFHPLYVRWFAKHRPDVYRGMLYTTAKREKRISIPIFLLNSMTVNAMAKPQFIAHHEVLKKSIPIQICTRFFHTTTFIWTIKNKSRYDALHALGQHVIFESFVP